MHTQQEYFMHTLTTIEQPTDIASEGRLRRFVAKGKQLLPGLALALAIAVVSIEAGKLDWLQANGIGALTLAIVLGIVVGNTFYARIAVASEGGVAFSKQNLL